MLLGGRKGHLALMNWNRLNLMSEFHVRETTRDVAILHNHGFFAAAQKKYVCVRRHITSGFVCTFDSGVIWCGAVVLCLSYIYDKDGVELHVLRKHIQPNVIDFLPYHFLLVSVGKAGYLKYQV